MSQWSGIVKKIINARWQWFHKRLQNCYCRYANICMKKRYFPFSLLLLFLSLYFDCVFLGFVQTVMTNLVSLMYPGRLKTDWIGAATHKMKQKSVLTTTKNQWIFYLNEALVFSQVELEKANRESLCHIRNTKVTPPQLISVQKQSF